MIATRIDDKFALRLPNGLRDRVRVAAREAGRSMNTEIVMTLERVYRSEAATGEGLGNHAPAAALNTAALAGRDIINHGNEVTADDSH